MDATLSGIIDGIFLGLVAYLGLIGLERFKIIRALRKILVLISCMCILFLVAGPIFFLDRQGILEITKTGHAGQAYVVPYMCTAIISVAVAFFTHISIGGRNNDPQ